jgi:murein DD-endopeptidase MepM/ murein hydrolase activator NlpD
MVSLAIDPPPSARRERRPRRGLLAAVFSLAVLGALAAGFWLGRATAPKPPPAATAPAEAPAAQAAAPTATPTAPAEASAAQAPAPTANATANPTATATAITGGVVTPIPNAPATPGAPRRLAVTLNGSLEASVARALPAEDRGLAEQLTAVVNRLLVWDLQVARDGRKGDRLDVLWTPPVAAAPGVPATGEPVVVALRYASSKLGGVLAAYRYEPKGERWARYYRADSTELEERLVDAPIGDYEQVTSLLRDGRRHKGVDFKAPVGSPVLAPFDGVIERRNWNFAGNGNCLDLRDPATGRHAIFLHLDVVPKEMSPGRKVRKGEVIAASGNSGRSYAPHLHYQLEDGAGRVVDPFEAHRTERRVLPAAEKVTFEAMRARLDGLLGG